MMSKRVRDLRPLRMGWPILTIVYPAMAFSALLSMVKSTRQARLGVVRTPTFSLVTVSIDNSLAVKAVSSLAPWLLVKRNREERRIDSGARLEAFQLQELLDSGMRPKICQVR